MNSTFLKNLILPKYLQIYGCRGYGVLPHNSNVCGSVVAVDPSCCTVNCLIKAKKQQKTSIKRSSLLECLGSRMVLLRMLHNRDVPGSIPAWDLCCMPYPSLSLSPCFLCATSLPTNPKNNYNLKKGCHLPDLFLRKGHNYILLPFSGFEPDIACTRIGYEADNERDGSTKLMAEAVIGT